MSRPLLTLQATQFSEFFRELDKKSLKTISHEYYVNKEYKRLMDQWQVPLLRKQIKREKRLQNPVQPQPEADEVLYVHNPEEGVALPPNPEKVFAVVRVKGLQYKVAKDDRVMVELLDHEVGTQLALEDVLMVGTQDYTCIGRPAVKKAHVLVTVEETSQTEKVLIFKKRRRKDSQRHQGHRHWVTVLRVDRIVHELAAQTASVEVLNLKPTVI